MSIFFSNFLIAQLSDKKTNGALPDFEINNLINSADNNIKLSKYKGKLIIIDFWATWCNPCVREFPKIDSLQNQFKEQIQIISITQEDIKVVRQFMEKYQKVNGLYPLIGCNDTILSKTFPHIYLPHYVWIDKDGRLLAVTDATQISEENIQSYLSGHKLQLVNKKDNLVEFVNETMYSKPAFGPSINIFNGKEKELKKIDDADVIIHTALTKYVKEIGTSGTASPDSTLYSAWNRSILGLYTLCLWKQGLESLNISNASVEIKDSTLYELVSGKKLSGERLFSPGLQYLEWIRKNGYCYEIKVPPNMANLRFKIMLEDLNRYFGALYNIEGVILNRERRYLALVQIGESNILECDNCESQVKHDSYSLLLKGGHLSDIPYYLSTDLQKYPPIINETNFKGKINLEINCKLSDLKSLNIELERYGLKLEEKVKLLPTAIVRERAKF